MYYLGIYIHKKEIYMRNIFCKTSVPIKYYNLHSHTEWEIVCQLNGEVLTYVDDKTITLRQGDILLIPPRVKHRGVSKEEFRDLSLRADGMDFSKLSVFHDTRGDIIKLISMIHRLMTEKQGDYKTVTDSLAESVIKMIKYEIGVTTDSPAIEQIKKNIFENYCDPTYCLIESIVKTGFDKDYFRRCFKEATGKTPTQYLTELRINRAKQLLSDNKMFSVSSIAENCGFSDSLYFSTCFKKHVGVSPLNYRKKRLGDISKDTTTQKKV